MEVFKKFYLHLWTALEFIAYALSMKFLSTKALKNLSHNALNTYWRPLSVEMHFAFFKYRLFFNLLTVITLSKLTENSPHPIVRGAKSCRITKFFCGPSFCCWRRDVAKIRVQGWYQPIEIPYILKVKMLKNLIALGFQDLFCFLKVKLYKSYNRLDSGGSRYTEVMKNVLLSASLQQTWTMGIS